MIHYFVYVFVVPQFNRIFVTEFELEGFIVRQ
jgi:hypothetical protein